MHSGIQNTRLLLFISVISTQILVIYLVSSSLDRLKSRRLMYLLPNCLLKVIKCQTCLKVFLLIIGLLMSDCSYAYVARTRVPNYHVYKIIEY